MAALYSSVLPNVLKLVGAWQTAQRVAAVGKTRELITATIGLVVIVALPALLIYYVRRRWRP